MKKSTSKLGDNSLTPDVEIGQIKGVGKPATNTLAYSLGITRLSQLTKVTQAELLNLHGMGPKALRVLKEELHKRGLDFKSS